jgi:V8-like Glu-specific endopeptidase
MNRLLLICFLSFITISTIVEATDYGLNAIYKKDERQFITSKSPAKIKELAKSIAMIIHKDSLHGLLIETNKLTDPSGLNICIDEKFSQSNSVASCTGFLVAPDLLVTAGHCVPDAEACQDKLIVFDVLESSSKKDGYHVKKKNIFSCKEILTTDSANDIRIIRLDRNVNGRKSLKTSSRGSIILNQKVFMIGHPIGMPLMLSKTAFVLDIEEDIFFRADLDSFVGNSGSPVFNQNTSEVEGVLINGQEDFIIDPKNQCNRYINYSPSSGQISGESVNRINSILNVIESDRKTQE